MVILHSKCSSEWTFESLYRMPPNFELMHTEQGHAAKSYTTHGNTLQNTTTHCNTLQHAATHCNTLQHTATHCNTRKTLQHAATRCNTLQHTHRHKSCPTQPLNLNLKYKPIRLLIYNPIGVYLLRFITPKPNPEPTS